MKIGCWFIENSVGVGMLKLEPGVEKMDGVVGVEKLLVPPNWKVDLLLSPGVSLLSNMPAHHYDTININI